VGCSFLQRKNFFVIFDARFLISSQNRIPIAISTMFVLNGEIFERLTQLVSGEDYCVLLKKNVYT